MAQNLAYLCGSHCPSLSSVMSQKTWPFFDPLPPLSLKRRYQALFASFASLFIGDYLMITYHVTPYNPLYLEKGSFSDHVSYVNLHQRWISDPTVYDMTIFGNVFLNLPYDVMDRLRHFRSADNKIPPSLNFLISSEYVCKISRSDDVAFESFW